MGGRPRWRSMETALMTPSTTSPSPTASPAALRSASTTSTGAAPAVPLSSSTASPSSARIWDFTAPILAEHFRVLAVDQRGHGLSDKPGSYTFDDVTGDLAAFIEALGLERPVIAGHSWGAGVVLRFAADHPGTPAAIALIDGGFVERSSSPDLGAGGGDDAPARD